MANLNRLGTATMYANSISMMSKQQKDLADQVEKVSAGKKILRPSDDPVAAAQAERARTRLARIDTDQRALAAQRTTMTYAESTLGNINDALVEFRALVTSAGNGAYSQVERDAVATQMASLRAQILNYANRKDSNGLPLFRGLDSQDQIIQGQYNYAGQPGQTGSSEYGITNSLNGALAFMDIGTGNGVLSISMGVDDPANPGTTLPNNGTAWADVGTIRDPSAAAALTTPATIQFKVDAVAGTTYTVDGLTFQPYTSGQAITVAGMEVHITGTPSDGDGFTVAPSQKTDLFTVMDNAIAAIRGVGTNGALQQGLSKALSEVDTAMNRVSTVRGYAGDLLNQADRMDTALQAREGLAEAQRSDAEDIDAVKGLSDLESKKLGVSVALQSYASIQKLSLFNFIN